MKAFAVLAIVAFSAVFAVADETCKANIGKVCSGTEKALSTQCSAQFAGALLSDENSVLGKLQKFAGNQLEQSFEFMLRASYFGNYKASRAGFAKLFRGLSDAAWNDAIAVAKLVAQRGGRSVFVDSADAKKDKPAAEKAMAVNWERWARDTDKGDKPITIGIEELPSLGRALDSVKRLATEANGIHHRATHHAADPGFHRDQHDAHIAHYMEEEFSGRYAKEVRALAGHASDLKQLLLGNEGAAKPSLSEKSLSLFLFDEYLLKL